MKHFNKNKKGMAFVEVMVVILLLLLLAGMSIYVYNKFFKNTNKVVDSKFACSGVIGMGECKETCLSSEQKFENAFGCPPKDSPLLKFCCISLDEKEQAQEPENNQETNQPQS